MLLKWTKVTVIVLLILGIFSNVMADENLTAKNSKSWSMSGRVQIQHLYNSDLDSDAAKTNNGFRMRRVRLQTKASLNDWVSGKIQFEVRDNNPTLKDAEGKIKLFGDGYFRFGQFKVPVWREEFKRSSGKLLLVERSEAAGFLEEAMLSGRQIGVEIGGEIGENVDFAVNYSNGSGAGNREDGRPKSDETNNGKMIVARLDGKVGKSLKIGVSAVSNSLGSKVGTADNTGAVSTIAPDFGLYLKDAGLDIEGGVAFGKFSKDFLQTADDVNFLVFDVTGRWHKKLEKASESLGGMDAISLAAGFSRIDPNSDVDNDEESFFRFGPEFYFGKHTRIQVNGEIGIPSADGVDNTFNVRSQLTLNL